MGNVDYNYCDLQESFLQKVKSDGEELTIFLVNGVKLQGIISDFDKTCILLRRDDNSQLIYKHAVSTIMPGDKFTFDSPLA